MLARTFMATRWLFLLRAKATEYKDLIQGLNEAIQRAVQNPEGYDYYLNIGQGTVGLRPRYPSQVSGLPTTPHSWN